MRRLPILLALAIATPAVADPPRYPNQEEHDPRYQRERDREWRRDRPNRPDYNRRRDERRYDTWQRRPRDVHRRWQTLNTFVDARLGRTVVTVPRFYFGLVSDVRIENAYGFPMISRIEVIYDGRVQTLFVNTRLTPGQGIEIPIDPYRTVRQIIIYTNPRYRGGLMVSGS